MKQLEPTYSEEKEELQEKLQEELHKLEGAHNAIQHKNVAHYTAAWIKYFEGNIWEVGNRVMKLPPYADLCQFRQHQTGGVQQCLYLGMIANESLLPETVLENDNFLYIVKQRLKSRYMI